MTFEEFKNIIRKGEANGEIKTSKTLTDYDLAVQWAMGKIGERKGYPCDITLNEIWEEMLLDDDAKTIVDFHKQKGVSK